MDHEREEIEKHWLKRQLLRVTRHRRNSVDDSSSLITQSNWLKCGCFKCKNHVSRRRNRDLKRTPNINGCNNTPRENNDINWNLFDFVVHANDRNISRRSVRKMIDRSNRWQNYNFEKYERKSKKRPCASSETQNTDQRYLPNVRPGVSCKQNNHFGRPSFEMFQKIIYVSKTLETDGSRVPVARRRPFGVCLCIYTDGRHDLWHCLV